MFLRDLPKTKKSGFYSFIYLFLNKNISKGAILSLYKITVSVKCLKNIRKWQQKEVNEINPESILNDANSHVLNIFPNARDKCDSRNKLLKATFPQYFNMVLLW